MPAGVYDGYTTRVAGMGHDHMFVEGSGDLVVEMFVDPSTKPANMERDSSRPEDLHVTVRVSIALAASPTIHPLLSGSTRRCR